MELRHLRYFVAVVEAGSITAAARELLIAQPSLSRQLQDLERAAGLPLLHRCARGVEPTEAGWRLLPRARTALDAYDAALPPAGDGAGARGRTSGERESLTDRSPARFTFGLFPGLVAAGELTVPILQAIRRVVGHDGLRVQELDFTQPATAYRSGQVDAALVRLPVGLSDLAVDRLFGEPRMVVLPTSHPLTEVEDVVPADLQDLDWNGCGGIPKPVVDFWQLGDVWDTRDLRRVAAAPDGILDLLAQVGDGLFISTVPAAVSRYHRGGGVTFRTIRGAADSVCALAWNPLDARPLIDEVRVRVRQTVEALRPAHAWANAA